MQPPPPPHAHTRPQLPIIVVANKIDMDRERASKSFGFLDRRRAERQGGPDDMPLYFASASDGSNVVSIFDHAIRSALAFRELAVAGRTENFVSEVMEFLAEEGKRDATRAKQPLPPALPGGPEGDEVARAQDALERRLQALEGGTSGGAQSE
jgi:hypothetical protein